MRTLALGAVFAAAGLAWATGRTDTPRTPSAPEAPVYAAAHARPAAATTLSPATMTEVVQRYCVVCHNDQMMTGNVSFQAIDVERAYENPQTAERMIRKLRAGMMPPPGMPRPGGDTLQMLVETLETRIDEAARGKTALGQRRFTRLTRGEYNRVVKDLLNLDIDAAQWLPPDVMMVGFDNMAPAQGLSTTLLDAFMRAANEVSRLAVGNPAAATVSAKYVNRDQVSQHAWDRLEGAPYGTRGGMVVTHNFPVDGEYVFHVETRYGDRMFEEDLDISVDGEPVALVMLEHQGSNLVEAVETAPVFVKAGQHRVSAAFVNQIDGMYEDRFSAPKWSGSGNQGGQYGITGLAHVREFMITGPINPKGVSDTPSREKIFVCRPKNAAEQRPCADKIIRSLVPTAYRRPVTNEDVAELLKFYDEGAADSFDTGVRMAVQAILSSPEFLFRLEREPANVQPGQGYRIADLDLATRLSFFLWSSAPDKELLDLAAQNKLHEPAVLEQQVHRMLKDPRSEALSSRFLHQWLKLQDVGKVWPEAYMFPDFSQQLAKSMVKETESLFAYLIQQDQSLLELFRAKYSFLNERLAQHYGITNVYGDEFRKVDYPAGSPRIGILSHASVLHLTSMSDRTSPVLRGKWTMEVLMGTPPPPPPPNVPVFSTSSATVGNRILTTRERMENHRKAPVCNSCHSFIDPIGLALDNFDPTGRWRIRENGAPLDTRGRYYDGTDLNTPEDLANVLLKRPIPLVRNFTNRMLAYAIGRPTEYFDQPTVRAIAKAAEADGYKISSLIMGVVKSDAFQMRQTQTTAN